MFKLRHLCLQQLEECPAELADDIRWEVENKIKKIKKTRENIEDSIQHLRLQRLKSHSTLSKKLTNKIQHIEDEISEFLFDYWIPVDEKEEIWKEYFFCLYDFMISEKVQVDLSNIRLLSHDSIKIYEVLEKPRLIQSSDVRLLDYKFLELYTVFKNIEVPDIPTIANRTLKKNIEITEQLSKKRKNMTLISSNLKFYEELLSSSLCSRK